MPQKGKRYENDVARELTRETDDSCVAWPVGYSGNIAVPAPDVIGLTNTRGFALELKKYRDDISVPHSDLMQLLDVQKQYLDVALLIKFSHREPVLIEPTPRSLDAFTIEDDIGVIERFIRGTPDVFEPRCVDGGADEQGALRLSKPSTDEWPSAQVGDDAVEKIQQWVRN